MAGVFMPLELVDKCVGSRVWCILKSEKEIVGLLKGFDPFLNLVLEDVVEYDIGASHGVGRGRRAVMW
eukprot:gene23990-2733_t